MLQYVPAMWATCPPFAWQVPLHSTSDGLNALGVGYGQCDTGRGRLIFSFGALIGMHHKLHATTSSNVRSRAPRVPTVDVQGQIIIK
jgi:hypothetical protein